VPRTTLTLDDDVAAKLKAEARRRDRPFREVVNEALRRGLLQRPTKPIQPFQAAVRDMGSVPAGLSLDNVAELLETVEGPLHR
jgi:hypothetical protein